MISFAIPSSVQVFDRIKSIVDPALCTLVNLVSLYPGLDVAAEARRAVANWTGAVEFVWAGVDGFDINRTEAGVLLGIREADFIAGWARGSIACPRTTLRMAAAAQIFRAAGKSVSFTHFDIEPNSVPGTRPPDGSHNVWPKLRPDGNGKMLPWWKANVEPAYNTIVLNSMRDALRTAGLWTQVSDVCVEFKAFSNRDFCYGVDSVGAEVAFNPVVQKFRSSCEFYSRFDSGDGNPNATRCFAAWIAGVDDPAMPVLDACDSDVGGHTRKCLALCRRYGARPVFWINEAYETGKYPVSVENQARWLMTALAAA